MSPITDKGVHENRRSCGNLKEKTNHGLNKAYEDSSDSSEDNIGDNYDSNEKDFPSEQADDQNIQNDQLNLKHADDQQAVDQPTQNPQSNLENPTIQHSKFQNLELRFSISYHMKMK